MAPDRVLDSGQAFHDRWLAEAVRIREQTEGTQADAVLVERLRGGGESVEVRILERAREIGARWGLDESIRRWTSREHLLAWVLCVAAVLAGFAGALAVLGNGERPVNVVWALVGLLGLHFLSLLGWFVALGLASARPGGIPGRVWQMLSVRLSVGSNAEVVGRARLRLHARTGLERWWLGAVTHGFWLMLLFGMLLGLLFGLALRRYGFIWETTILPATVFEGLVVSLGWLPSLLGFPVPDPALVRASGDIAVATDTARRIWSMWLVGCLLAYGLLPRLALWALCTWRLADGRRRLRLYPDDPAFAGIAERLAPSSERIGVSDAAPERLETAHVASPHQAGGAAMVVGIELDRARVAWPPELPAGVRDGGIVDSREQRSSVLAALEDSTPVRLLLACDPRLSPDRGSLALIAAMSAHAGACAVWLSGADTISIAASERLKHWHEALASLGLAESAVFSERGKAMEWLSDGV